MSKTFRLNFEKGINVVGDKALLPDGFATILDNVDLRSGSPRPYRSPEYQFQVGDAINRSWSYRGRWFHSDNDRDYVGEFIGGIERVYINEEGKFPTKSIEGDVVLLGTPRPKTILGVAKSTSLTPSGLRGTVTYVGNGNLADGFRYYRVSARTKDGIMPPSAAVMITIDDTTHAGADVLLTWGSVTGALSYIVFEGDSATQSFLYEVSSSFLTYRDTGTNAASGDTAAQYLQEQAFPYAYTYKRNVNGVYDESGMSSLSISVSGATGRIITRDYVNDGYFDQLQNDGVTPAAITGILPLALAISITFGKIASN